MSYPIEVQERLDQSRKLVGEAKAILLDPKATVEDKAKVAGMFEDSKKLGEEAQQLMKILEYSDDLAKQVETKQGEDKEKGKRKDETKFADWSDFLYAAWRAEHRDAAFRKTDARLQRFIEREKKSGHEEKTMAESTGAAGGFLVPAEFFAQLQAVMAEDALVRGRATKIRMRRREIDIPVLDQTGTTAGLPHWFGGMRFYWAEEAALKTESDASFRQVQLVAHKLIGYTRASDELVDDSAISLGDFLSGPLGFAGGVAWMEDFAFIQGTGAGQPLGVINAGATLVVPRAAAPNVSLADLLNMVEDFLPSGRGVWFYTQSALSELMQINGPAANPSYVFMPSAREGVPDTIFGMPAIRTEKCPRLGTQGDFILADWRYYLIGDRQAATIDSTQYDYWRYDQTSWRVVHRVDGQPWLSAPLTLQDGTSQVSPFVILGDKST